MKKQNITSLITNDENMNIVHWDKGVQSMNV